MKKDLRELRILFFCLFSKFERNKRVNLQVFPAFPYFAAVLLVESENEQKHQKRRFDVDFHNAIEKWAVPKVFAPSQRLDQCFKYFIFLSFFQI